MSSKIKSRQLADGADAQNELRRYCDITGETAQAVHDRRRKGEWVDGKHCHMKRGRLWIDVPGIANWVRSEA
jgi:hypothetical protein